MGAREYGGDEYREVAGRVGHGEIRSSFFNNSKNGLFFECPPVPCIVLLTGGYSWAKTDETPSSQFPINQEATINR